LQLYCISGLALPLQDMFLRREFQLLDTVNTADSAKFCHQFEPSYRDLSANFIGLLCSIAKRVSSRMEEAWFNKRHD
jgi:hypothetical protein